MTCRHNGVTLYAKRKPRRSLGGASLFSVAPGLVAESSRAVRRAEARRAVVTHRGVAEIGLLAVLAGFAGAVAARRYVVQRVGMRVEVAAIVHRAGLVAVDAADQGRGNAGAAEAQPLRHAAVVRAIDRDAGVRIG